MDKNNDRFAAQRRGGKKGGRARAKKLTAERRREIAALGGASRWAGATKKERRCHSMKMLAARLGRYVTTGKA